MLFQLRRRVLPGSAFGEAEKEAIKQKYIHKRWHREANIQCVLLATDVLC
jgi:hypothetical protein